MRENAQKSWSQSCLCRDLGTNGVIIHITKLVTWITTGPLESQNENNPLRMARFLKKMGREIREEPGADFDEAMGSLEEEEMKLSLPGMDEQSP